MFLGVSTFFIFDPCTEGWFFISKDTDNRQPSLPEQTFWQFPTLFSGGEEEGGKKPTTLAD